MKLNLKMLAVSAALLGLLAAGAALPASAAGPLNAAAALSLPWSAAAVESVETGTYASTMTVGTQQQLSPVILPAKAARKATVTFMSNDSTIVNVTSEGVAQAVGVGTAQVIASADGVSCVYTITTELDESMIVKEMDITLASGTIAVGETTSLSLGVLPSSASNYANVSLSSSDPAVATVNNFGKVTGVAPGTATITATCGDVSASATVKVVNSGADRQSIDLNTSYVVLKPGASRTITGKVTPSSASQSLTFKSNDTKVATVSAKGVITAVGTGATSIVVSNGTASASVTVIVNRNASSSGNGGGSTDDSNGEVITDPVVEAIEADGTDEVTFAQRELPTITSEMLNALRLNGKTLVVEADNYTIRIAGRDVKNTSAQSLVSKMDFSFDATADTIRDLLELRIVLETFAAYHAAQRRTDEDIASIQKLLRDMREAKKVNDGTEESVQNLRKLSHGFHQALVRAAHNAVLSSVYEYRL